jgi:cell shape-determining protein MreD
MPARSASSFWLFIVVLVLLHLTLRLALGMTLIPDLLVVAVLLGGRRLGAPAAALLGLFLGVLADSLAMVAFGATAVAFVVAAYLGSKSRIFFEGDSYLFVLVYVFLGAWLIDAIRFFVGGARGRGELPMTLLTEAPLAALFTAVAAIVALIAYRALTRKR